MSEILRNFKRHLDPMRGTTVVSAELGDAIDIYLHRNIMDQLTDEIVKGLAAAYIEQHGPEVLKHLQEKTIDAKLIQKVIANLRKELSHADNETR